MLTQRQSYAIYSGRIRMDRINNESVIIQLITYTAEVLWRPILMLAMERADATSFGRPSDSILT